MSHQPDSPGGEVGLSGTPKGPDYRAVIDTEKCAASGHCITACEVEAISEGPKRLPVGPLCVAVELEPGKAVVAPDKCNGCGDCVSVCPTHAIQMVHVGAV